MNIRSRLFATVAFPLLSLSVAIPPTLAAELMRPFDVAQADGAAMPAEPGAVEELPKKRKAQAEEAKPEEGGQAEPAPKRRKAEQPQEEPAQAEPKAEQPKGEPSEPAPKRRKAEQPQEEPAKAEQAPAEKAEPAPKPRKAEPQTEEPAKPEQPKAESAEPSPKPPKAEQPAAEPAPAEKPAKAGSAEPSADQPLSAEEKKRLRDERIKKRQDAGQQDGTKPAAAAGEAPQPNADKPLSDEEKKRLREERIKQRQDATQSGDQPPTADQAPVPSDKAPQPVDGAVPAPAGEETGADTPRKPRPEIVDPRTEEQKKQLALDPSKSNDTIVLPVDNGAAVLDSDKDADNTGGEGAREKRRQERARADDRQLPPPRSDADAQSGGDRDYRRPSRKEIDAANLEEGRRIDEAPEFNLGGLVDALTGTDRRAPRIRDEGDDRTVIDFGDQLIVRGDERPRLRRNAQESYYDELPRGRTRETIERPDGSRVVTVYNRYGDILQRSRIDQSGREYLMIYAPETDEGPRPTAVDIGDELPPMRLTVPVDDYIIDTSSQPDRDYYRFLAEPPVERVERVYSIDEVRNSARIRDKVRRIDLDTVTFATNSADVPSSQARSLAKVADAMMEVINKDPGETFLIEGHTDAVGSDQANLVLSDKRAESVASLLTDVYEIPPENLITQGYGERFLKVRTDGPEQENRRVTIRRVTPLVRPVAQK